MTAPPPPDEARDAWDAIAHDYDRRVTEHYREVAGHALRRLEPLEGRSLLDVAAGSGAFSLAAARRGAQVTATDIAPAMIEHLRSRAQDEGQNDLDAVVMDGHQLELPQNTFDIAASQFGVMVIDDIARGLSEMARVTRPGGRVGMITFGALPPELEFLDFFLGAARAVEPELPDPFAAGPPPPLRVTDPNTLSALLDGAGLSEVTVEQIDTTMVLASGEELWDFVMSTNPLTRVVVGGLTEDQRAEVRRVIDGMLEERVAVGDGVLHNPVLVGVGTV